MSNIITPMKYDVFISYSRKDSDIANKICEILKSQEPGISYFIDKTGISGGNDFPSVLADAIEQSAVVLFLASRNSYASDYTAKEVTYTISKKGSTAILPLIIDGSTLPPALEFQLSNINWRTLGPAYTLEDDLVADIMNKLKDPSAGETLEVRKHKKDKKILFGSIAAVCAVLIATLFVFTRYNSARQKAVSDSEYVKSMTIKADSLIASAALLSNPYDSESSLDEELADLDLAAEYAGKAIGIIQSYQGSEYMPYFNIDPGKQLQAVKAKKDSMFAVWSDRANDAYAFYQQTGSKVEKELASRFASDALMIRPDDQEMSTLITTIHNQP